MKDYILNFDGYCFGSGSEIIINNKQVLFKPLEKRDTKFIHPVRVTFNQNGKEKSWEAVRSHDSVAILLYHTQKDSFLHRLW